MLGLCAFVLLSVTSQALAQNFFPVYGRNNNPRFSPNAKYAGDRLEETDLSSPFLSKFATYYLQLEKDSDIYPRLYDVSFSPDALKENFYNEAIYFLLDNGVYEVGSLPQQLADAAAQASPNLTPIEIFKVTSNTLELVLQNNGIGTEGNYQVLTRLYAKAIKDATDLIKVHDASSALHAIMVGSGVFLKSLSLDSPDNVRYAIATYADQFFKVPTTSTS